MTLTLIAAAAENNALGKDNQMIWRLPDDFKRFKQLTTGHHIIMGRKTLESMNGPLPNRTNVVITRQPDYTYEGCTIVNSLNEALAACPQNQEVFIIGGGEIYKQSINMADKIELTRVLGISPEADAYFPEIDSDEWNLTESVFHDKDEKHAYEFIFETWERE
ncbi:dihydrofolate reductase [Flavobacterium subsaxonicum]|uniref:Dihydrofolate reductase n=1 Tax=Flavobacterium subsaxonicum WB 4.1-42 = DSM 21790 TaxID=1121898 RepID=A0A0A2MRF7_9FLAO|nr:dihydrofolate reductase [Flavobacterium subsaxonicum]KGO94146.1 diacylglycerol kinase [Flavobacterium subsaxonicum WB 4.1-42 = DSM 21790]